VRRIKILADLVPYVTDRPQDGRLSFLARDPDGGRHEIAVRVAVVPSSRGEKITLRLAGDARARSLDSLGWSIDDRQRFEKLLSQPQGMIVLTGPTGCGKTTTLYSALGHLHASPAGRALASIEDPVEVDLPFVQQTAVDRTRGLGFAEALRAILRQDPDVLMVGEIRDPETARIAVQAALSGHLLLTTLHADSALGVFPRLIDLDVEPFLVGSATLACVAQRLLPRLCSHCRHPGRVAPELRRRATALGLPDDTTFHTAEGCRACENSGFDGRVGVFEILHLDSALRRRIAARESVDSLRAAAHEAGHRSLADAALDAARRGDVTLRDALTVLGEDLT
ncbi:MAG: ATPase, T2SS/T4P/T4SS family, partial [Acidobacteriota bacterium]